MQPSREALPYLVHNLGLLLDSRDREVSSTNLLGDTSSFTLLNVSLTNLIDGASDQRTTTTAFHDTR
jgi:hypothetical protein